MYAPFFGLKHEPFSIAPDPRYLFMSERHREALAHLLYGLGGGGGFVLLTGEIGAGKTTVCRCFLEQIPRRCHVAYIFNPKLTVVELLKSVCDEFRIPCDSAATVKDYVDHLNEYLLKTHAVGQNSVLIIDEAQNLSPDVLEQLRLLTNLETSERKLLQIVLIGQPELRDMLARPELEQLAQRVIARFHLDALSEAETAQYIRHRLAVAGMKKAIPFDRGALKRIHQLARGVPRRINLLCDRALLGAYGSERSQIDKRMVAQAAREVFDLRPPARAARAGGPRAAVLAGGMALGAGLFALVLAGLNGGLRSAPAAVAQAAPAASKPAASRPVAASAPVLAAAHAASVASAAAPPFTPLADEHEAWRELAGAWGLALAEGDPCAAAEREHLRCYKRPHASLALIRQLGRPGILTLRDEAGRSAYALLTALGTDRATLRAGATTRSVSLGSLALLWQGDFATFWRAPPAELPKSDEPATGALADWLSARLATVPDAPAASLPLRARIHAFQVAQGLEADGRAGPMTLMQLNRASGVPEPRLASE